MRNLINFIAEIQSDKDKVRRMYTTSLKRSVKNVSDCRLCSVCRLRPKVNHLRHPSTTLFGNILLIPDHNERVYGQNNHGQC